MSRIRSIHPGLWTDDAFMALSSHARLLIIGIWTEAFDDGVFEWKPLTLKARIFPVDTVDVTALLDELVAGSLVRREEVGGRQYGLVRNFRHYQRPKKPNSSGLMRPEWGTYVGISEDSGEPVPNQSATSGEKSPQMEDGGGKMEDEIKTPPPITVAEEGARDLFTELWEAFPQNPSSSETKAKKALETIKPSERLLLLSAAVRYAKWFGQDCEARGRTVDAGLRYVPHLCSWLDSGEWREAAKLPVKGEGDPSLAVVRRGTDDFAALERLRQRSIPDYLGETITVKLVELEQARAGAVH